MLDCGGFGQTIYNGRDRYTANRADRTPRRDRRADHIAAASATRDQAAAWVAGQVSGGAVLACDPAMCAALAQRGIPAGNLLVLGPGSGDPLGSAVVVETAAVRAGRAGPRARSARAC